MQRQFAILNFVNTSVIIYHFVDECPNMATDFYKSDYDTGHIEYTEGSYQTVQ